MKPPNQGRHTGVRVSQRHVKRLKAPYESNCMTEVPPQYSEYADQGFVYRYGSVFSVP